ncbi:MAG TPA: PAS domain S-box protein, partial [Gammaproteobacteria bacterium]|nr:PAS domain S-box protein [Gammaproteobacteria bacterium]
MKLASAFNHSPNLVTLTRLTDDSYVDVNDSFERVLGYARAAVIGKNPVALGLWDSAGRERFLSALRKSRSIANEPANYRRRDGGEYHGMLNAEVVSFEGEDYVLSIIQDSGGQAGHDAARRRALEAEAALQASEQKYRTLVDHSQDGVFITHDDKYSYVNQAYADMLGYTTAEMIGSPYKNFIAPEDRSFLDELW